MKKTLLLTAFTAAALSSSALADSFGIRLGYPLGVQYTLDNAVGRGTDLRIAGYVNPFSSALAVGVQADALVDRPLGESRDLSLFYGGGANLEYVGGTGFSAFGIGVQGTGGISYKLDSSISLFADVSVGINYYSGGIAGFGFNGIAPYYGGALGVNFKL